MKTALYLEGDRVRVRRGPFPVDPDTVGREGVVVRRTEGAPILYGVKLDGGSAPRDFAEEELAPAGPSPSPPA